MDCIRVASDNNPNATVLDFFAGSGTTGHAVMELNKIDNGKRRFILSTNNENKISEDVTYERIKRVSSGYRFEGKVEEELLKVDLSISNLKKMDEILEEINLFQKSRVNNFDSFNTKSENGYLTLKGINKKVENIHGIPHNIKYLKTDFIPKLSEDDEILSERLLSHVKEMVELENMCEIDGRNKLIILTQDQLDDWYKKGMTERSTVYLPSYILISREIEIEAKKNIIEFVDIPDYYFLDELREVNEL